MSVQGSLTLYFKDVDKEIPLAQGNTVFTRALLEDIYARDTSKALIVKRFCSRVHFKIYCDRYGGVYITPLGSNGLSYEVENKCKSLQANERIQIDPDQGPHKLFLFRNGLPIYLKGYGREHPDLTATNDSDMVTSPPSVRRSARLSHGATQEFRSSQGSTQDDCDSHSRRVVSMTSPKHEEEEENSASTSTRRRMTRSSTQHDTNTSAVMTLSRGANSLVTKMESMDTSDRHFRMSAMTRGKRVIARDESQGEPETEAMERQICHGGRSSTRRGRSLFRTKQEGEQNDDADEIISVKLKSEQECARNPRRSTRRTTAMMNSRLTRHSAQKTAATSAGNFSGRDTSADSYEDRSERDGEDDDGEQDDDDGLVLRTPTFTPCKRQKLFDSQLKVEVSQSEQTPFMSAGTSTATPGSSTRRRSSRQRLTFSGVKSEEAICVDADEEDDCSSCHHHRHSADVTVKEAGGTPLQGNARTPLSDRKRRYTPMRTRRMAKLFMNSEMDTEAQEAAEKHKNCPICLNDIDEQDEASLKCNHRFCGSCIQDWAKVTNKCPLCKCDFNQIEMFLNGRFNKAIEVETKVLKPEDFEPYWEEYEDRCVYCDSADDAESLLLCDSCDQGYHMYCLRPSLRYIPTDNWYCQECVRDDGILISEYLGPKEYHAFLESVEKPEFEYFLDFNLYTRLLNQRRTRPNKSMKDLYCEHISRDIDFSFENLLEEPEEEERSTNAHYNLRRVESAHRESGNELAEFVLRMRSEECANTEAQNVDEEEKDEVHPLGDGENNHATGRRSRTRRTSGYNLRTLDSVPDNSRAFSDFDSASELNGEEDQVSLAGKEMIEDDEQVEGIDDNRRVTRSLTLRVCCQEDIATTPETDIQASRDFHESDITTVSRNDNKHSVPDLHEMTVSSLDDESADSRGNRRLTRSRTRSIKY